MTPAAVVTAPPRSEHTDLTGSVAEQLRLIVAPANGRFRPSVTEGPLREGELLGVVAGSRGRGVEVRCPTDLTVQGLLTLPGHLVMAGQALAWARIEGLEGGSA